MCDLAESLNVSLLLGCCANFNILEDVCASWYPSGFKIVSKGKDKHRDLPIDFFGYFHPKTLDYDLRISKMCRFGHRAKHTPIYRNPHPIQLCDVTIKGKYSWTDFDQYCDYLRSILFELFLAKADLLVRNKSCPPSSTNWINAKTFNTNKFFI